MTCTIQIWMPPVLPVVIGASEPLAGVDAPTLPMDASSFEADVRSLSLPVDQHRSPFFLPPSSSRYLCGLLGETGSGRMVLGVSKYLEGGHEGIDFAMSEVFGASRILLWGGEILLRNEASVAGMGMAVAWNETTGYLDRLSRTPSPDGRAVKNSVENVRNALQTLKALNVAPDARFISFDPMNQHLDPLLQAFSERGSYRNVRHGLLNATSGLGFIFGNLEIDSFQNVLEQLSEMSEDLNNIKTAAIILMRDNPSLSGELGMLVAMIERIIERDPSLNEAELKKIMDPLIFFDELFSLPVEKRTITFDLFPA